jgi:membrane associated rhomboid family serine protease
MSRYGRPSAVSYSFGPGPMTPAVKAIIWANIALFVVTLFYPPIVEYLGLVPEAVLERFSFWQLATYMFLHAGPLHILFNMLGVWMFGTDLERLWGTRTFARYYAITGVGAGVVAVAASFLPVGALQLTYSSVTIGASGALYAILLAYAMRWPERPILLILIPVPAKYFVMIYGALALLSVSDPRVSAAAHLGGLLVGYLYLKQVRIGGFTAEIKYRYLKWRMNRLRRKFDVYSGGKKEKDWDRHVH